MRRNWKKPRGTWREHKKDKENGQRQTTKENDRKTDIRKVALGKSEESPNKGHHGKDHIG